MDSLIERCKSSYDICFANVGYDRNYYNTMMQLHSYFDEMYKDLIYMQLHKTTAVENIVIVDNDALRCVSSYSLCCDMLSHIRDQGSYGEADSAFNKLINLHNHFLAMYRVLLGFKPRSSPDNTAVIKKEWGGNIKDPLASVDTVKEISANVTKDKTDINTTEEKKTNITKAEDIEDQINNLFVDDKDIVDFRLAREQDEYHDVKINTNIWFEQRLIESGADPLQAQFITKRILYPAALCKEKSVKEYPYTQHEYNILNQIGLGSIDKADIDAIHEDMKPAEPDQKIHDNVVYIASELPNRIALWKCKMALLEYTQNEQITDNLLDHERNHTIEEFDLLESFEKQLPRDDELIKKIMSNDKPNNKEDYPDYYDKLYDIQSSYGYMDDDSDDDDITADNVDLAVNRMIDL